MRDEDNCFENLPPLVLDRMFETYKEKDSFIKTLRSLSLVSKAMPEKLSEMAMMQFEHRRIEEKYKILQMVFSQRIRIIKNPKLAKMWIQKSDAFINAIDSKDEQSANDNAGKKPLTETHRLAIGLAKAIRDILIYKTINEKESDLLDNFYYKRELTNDFIHQTLPALFAQLNAKEAIDFIKKADKAVKNKPMTDRKNKKLALLELINQTKEKHIKHDNEFYMQMIGTISVPNNIVQNTNNAYSSFFYNPNYNPTTNLYLATSRDIKMAALKVLPKIYSSLSQNNKETAKAVLFECKDLDSDIYFEKSRELGKIRMKFSDKGFSRTWVTHSGEEQISPRSPNVN